jgi:predicted alpha-1,6-mannanase (GH76 family)
VRDEIARKPTWFGRGAACCDQGVILGGLVELHGMKGGSGQGGAYLDEAYRIADAAVVALSVGGVLREPGEDGDLGADGPQFKGIFMRYLSRLARAPGGDAARAKRYGAYAVENAQSLWERGRQADTALVGVHWAGPFDKADAARQGSALDALNAAVWATP